MFGNPGERRRNLALSPTFVNHFLCHATLFLPEKTIKAWTFRGFVNRSIKLFPYGY
jgi:hypothetical protein